MRLNGGRHIFCYALFRGDMSYLEAQDELLKYKNDKAEHFKEWIDGNIASSMCTKSKPGFTNSSTLITNHTAISNIFKEVAENFCIIFRKKAYLQSYLSEGMDEMDFRESESNLNDLYSEYYECCCGCGDSDYYDELEEDAHERNSEDIF